MVPIPLDRASSIRAVSSSFTPRAITPPSNLLSRAVQAIDSTIPSTAIAARTLTQIKRQSNGIIAIPTTYVGLNAGPAPGTVVGIVLGAVGGFILCLYLIFTVFQLAGGGRRSTYVEEEVVRRRSVSRSRSPSTRRRSESRSEVVEVRRPERRRSERIVVEERTRRSSQPPPPEDDIVEVIEEHSPPRRHRSKRDSGGYRTVDPAEFGGGGRPMRKVRR